MPRAETTPGLNDGEIAEVRVAQAWFWDGYFVRRGIDLQHRFGPEVSTVTDLDVLGYSLDQSLKVHKHIGEVKTGKAKSTPKPLDRALWIRGLREIIGAESGEITTAFRVSTAARDVCGSLGVAIQHLDDLEVRESRLLIEKFDDIGSQGVTVARFRKRIQSFVRMNPLWERGYWFLASEVWFLEPFDALKRSLGLIKRMAREWPPESHKDESLAARWLFAEAISIVSLHLAIVAGYSNTMDRETFRELALGKLSSSQIPSFALHKLSDQADEYLSRILSSLGASAEVTLAAMGALRPQPPEYADQLLELIGRFSSEAGVVSMFPRQIDLILFERLVRRREISNDVAERLALGGDSERLMLQLSAFLNGLTDLPVPVGKVLTTPL